jgi:Fic family protein
MWRHSSSQPIEIDGYMVQASIPASLPHDLRRLVSARITAAADDAHSALKQLDLAASLMDGWYRGALVRKESLAALRMAAIRGTLKDLYCYEAQLPVHDIERLCEVVNYHRAFDYSLREAVKTHGVLELALLRGMHWRLLQTSSRRRGASKWRGSCVWVGGSHPGNAHYIPPPPDVLPRALEELQKWIARDRGSSPLVRIAIAHAQWMLLYPFPDGNLRMGLLLVMLLLRQLGLLQPPVLCLNTILQQRFDEYRERLITINSDGNWNDWLEFFLGIIAEAAVLTVDIMWRLASLMRTRRDRLLRHKKTIMAAMRLEQLLPYCPIVTVAGVATMIGTTKPTANDAIETLCDLKILTETTGRRRGRVFADLDYLQALEAKPVQ